MQSNSYAELITARDFFLKSYPQAKPTSAIILGSGLGAIADGYKIIAKLKFSDIPYLISPSIEGHSGEIILAELPNKEQAIFFKGRIHAYEGHDYDKVLFTIRWAHLIGCKNLIVTNAAGSVNLNFKPGDLVVIDDHINLSGKNPLIGKNIDELGPRFPDMTVAYDKNFREKLQSIAQKNNIALTSGVYGYVMGPTYETPAEIKMLRIIGADMVGMSTVPDVVAARHLGMKVLGISCITNFGSGIQNTLLKHDEVKTEAAKVIKKVETLISNFLVEI